MKTVLALVCTALCALMPLPGCGSNGSPATHSGSAKDGRARVVGTVVDAASGDVLANVKVDGPNGRSTRSDAHGRFEFTDLEIGTEGELTAATDDGRKARVPLRRLAVGRLEVVLQMTAR